MDPIYYSDKDLKKKSFATWTEKLKCHEQNGGTPVCTSKIMLKSGKMRY
jgi:hypothetical protein